MIIPAQPQCLTWFDKTFDFDPWVHRRLNKQSESNWKGRRGALLHLPMALFWPRRQIVL
jgi:hypothetical protein